jgi:lysophospholipase L1-like esterase
MRLTFHFLREMNLACRNGGCTFAVVIIPTKETVFAQYLKSASGLNLSDRIDAVIRNEEIAKSALEDVLKEAGIPYVDALPALRQNIGQRLYYPGPADMHPGPNGYRVIGETVAAFVREAGLAPRPEAGRLESRKAASQ